MQKMRFAKAVAFSCLSECYDDLFAKCEKKKVQVRENAFILPTLSVYTWCRMCTTTR